MRLCRCERGVATVYFVLLAGAVIFGFMVMAIDFGRLYLVQGELQTAADAAALSAATQLVGVANSTLLAGDIQTGQVGASFDNTDTNDNRFNLRLNQIGAGATDLLTSVLVDFFSSRLDAIGNVNGGQTGPNAKYARVTISAQTPVLFPQFINPTFTSRPVVVAAAVAGPSSPICTACGIGVLAIVDPSVGSDPVNFGLTQGSFYTLYLDVSMQTAPFGPTCTTSTPVDLAGTDTDVAGPLAYVVLDHVPTGGTIDADGTLYELAAAGMEQSDSDGIGPGQPPSGGIATVGGPQGAVGPEETFGTYTGLVPTTADPGQDVICGLNTLFGVDPTLATPCDTDASGEFVVLAQAFAADTDIGTGAYAAGTDLEDYGTEYAGNLRRVVTVPVVDDPTTLNVLGFRQFLVEADPTAAAGNGLNPTATGTTCQTGAFPAQYIGWPVPLRCGGVGGSCTVSFGAGRTVLH